MILIIAGRAARRPLSAALRLALRDRGDTPDIRLAGPADLSAAGWVHDPANPAAGRLVLAGDACPAARVTAVLTALDGVGRADLPHVRPADRGFVAAEMTAFLRGWLAALDCPVLDCPTTLALSGPAGDRAAWSAAAAALGVPDRQATAAPRARLQTVTVAGGRIVGPAPGLPPPAGPDRAGRRPATAAVTETALALTRAVGATAARLTFASSASADDGAEDVPALCAAAPWWHSPDPRVLRALLAEALARSRSGAARHTGAASAAPAPPACAGARVPHSAPRPYGRAARPRQDRSNPGRPLVLLWGIPGEGPLTAVQAALDALGTATVLVDQRRALATRILPADGHRPDGPLLTLPGGPVLLGQVTAAYPRPYPSVPDLPGGLPARGTARRHLIRLEHDLWHWLATTSALVLNRPAPAASNATKSLQSRVAAECGFLVPESLLTNDPEAALAFAARHGRVVYKGASGARTFAGLLDPADTGRLARLSTCPTYLQRHIAGTDVRVHLVGDAVFAAEVDSDAVDYRRAPGELRPTRLPAAVADRCRAVTESLGLPLAGIDLIRTADGGWFFLEANPSPGFTFFPDQDLVGAAIARLLTSGRAGGC